MKLTLKASTGVTIVVWREEHMFHARRAAEVLEPQVCLPVDLFEVIAELAGLDLEESDEAAEAIRLADEAQRRLPAPSEDDEGNGSSAGAGRGA